MVQPSSRREGFSAIPNVKWEDIGGLDFLRKEFDRYIVRRIKHPEDYEVLTIIFFSFIMLCMCVSHFARLHWKFKQKGYEGSSTEELKLGKQPCSIAVIMLLDMSGDCQNSISIVILKFYF